MLPHVVFLVLCAGITVAQYNPYYGYGSYGAYNPYYSNYGGYSGNSLGYGGYGGFGYYNPYVSYYRPSVVSRPSSSGMGRHEGHWDKTGGNAGLQYGCDPFCSHAPISWGR